MKQLERFKAYKFVPADAENVKENEPVKPIIRHYTDGKVRGYQCPLCMKHIFHMDNYCRGCGEKFTWDDIT